MVKERHVHEICPQEMAGLQNLWGRKEGALTKKEIFANDIPSGMDLAWHYKVFINTAYSAIVNN